MAYTFGKNMKRSRTIGTTEESIAAAEADLGRRLPKDFREIRGRK